VEVIDSRRPRIRRSLDLVRAVALLLAVLVLVGLGSIAGDTSRGANADITRLLSEVPHVFIRLFSALGAFGALAVPIAFVVRELVRGQSRRLIEAILTGVAAIGAIESLDRLVDAIPSTALYDALTRLGTGAAVRPLDAYLAALFAFVAVIGVSGDPLWRGLLILVTALYIVSAFTATRASLLSLILSLTIGATIGMAIRYIGGSVNDTPDAARIAAELARRDVVLIRMQAVLPRAGDHRTYLAEAHDGRRLIVHAFDRDLIASGAVHGIYRLIRLRSEIAAPPALSLERVAERRTLLSMSAVAAGVPVPMLVAGVPVGPDTIVLAYDRPHGSAMTSPTDAQLDRLWAIVARLHQHRITHRGLIASEILIDDNSQILLPIPTDGTAFASDLRIALDRVQLLVTTGALVGAERAVRCARTALSDDEMAATLPLLQPIALARGTRAVATHHLLDDLRSQIRGHLEQPAPSLAKVERVRPRTIITIAAVIVAGYLIIGQLGSVDLGTVFAAARWQWVPLVVLASVATYFAAALSLTGYVQERLMFRRTVLAQLAASFAGFVTPPAVGGLAINIRYLQKAKVSTAGAATSVGMSQVVNAVSHVVLLVAFAAATGASAHHSLPVPGWAFVAVGAVAVAALLALAVPIARRWLVSRLLPPLREALPRLLNLLSSPTKLAESVGGALALNICYILALWGAAHAFDADVGFAQVAVVYLAGAAIGSVAPTPGGLGAVELAMSTGLAAIGMSSAAAVSAVLMFRLATFWLPVPFGWIAMHYLQRREAL
jgi:uncharacterized membrane protein YbhN (UPF0104 family)